MKLQAFGWLPSGLSVAPALSCAKVRRGPWLDSHPLPHHNVGVACWSKSSAGMLGGCLAAVLTTAGCRQVVGFDEPRKTYTSPDAGVGASACGLPWNTAKCASCVNANCCDQSSACASDPPCAEPFQCHSRCAMGGWACQSQCWHDSPPWNSPKQPPLVACINAHCEIECGLKCGALGPVWAVPDAAAACQACLESDCDSVRACISSVDCVAMANCAASTPATNYACWDGGTIPLKKDLGACQVACGLGSDWSCVGHVQWPSAADGHVFLHSGIVRDYLPPQQPLAGATVSVCRYPEDPNCQTPLAQAQTGADGTAVLSISPPSGSNFFGLAANSYLQASLPTYATTLFSWGPPVSVPVYEPTPLVPMFRPGDAQMLFAPYNVAWDTTTRGVLLFVVTDCNRAVGGHASGVRVTLDGANDPANDPMVHRYYGQTSFDFSAAQTDNTGFGGFVNVLAGPVTVIATPLALGTTASSRRIVPVRAGTITVAFLLPTP